MNRKIIIGIVLLTIIGCSRRVKKRGATKKEIINGVVEDLEYIIETHASSPACFKVDGRPVIDIYPRAIREAQGLWEKIVKMLRKRHKVFLMTLYAPQYFESEQQFLAGNLAFFEKGV